MRVVVTGAGGLLGDAFVRILSMQHDVSPLRHADMDVTSPEQIHRVLPPLRPDMIIHCAAMADLDECEADPEKAFRVNANGTGFIVEAARKLGAAVTYISTDAVFNGEKLSPYAESDPTDPRTVYGRTKVLGEQMVRELPRHFIFRVSLLFGPGATNFVEKCLRKLRAGEQFVAASDQLGSVMYTLDAARKVQEAILARRYGLFHLSNQGTCTRSEVAKRAAELAGLDPEKIIEKPSQLMRRLALRSKYAVMSMNKLSESGFELPRSWPEALGEYVGSLSIES